MLPVQVAARSKGLWLLASWDCRFESRCHVCLSFLSVVCCEVEVSASD